MWFQAAQVYMQLRERESALRALERVSGAGMSIALAGDNPLFDALHGDTRFEELLKKGR